MFCSECGAENKSSAKFCEQCGHTIDSKVPTWTNGKPMGIVVIAILSFFGGMGQMVGGWIIAFVPHLMGFIATVTGEGIGASDHIASLKIAGMAAAFFISGVLTVAAAYGLWNFIGWGRVLAVILNGLGLFVGVILFFTTLDASQSAGDIALQLFGFGVAIWILVYLFRPNVRDLFHGPVIPTPGLAAELKTQIRNSASR